MSIIELENVSKSFKNQTLFENVSFKIESGSIIGFAGDNGVGKSVLFKLICGIYKPSSGDIVIRGKSIGKSYEFPEDIGVLIDEPGFVPIYSGFRNLRYLADIKNIATDSDIENIMTLVGLDPKSHKRVKNYSLGMKKKLAVAQALMENQSIVILDEPFNALDSASHAKLDDILLGLKSEGKVVLLTSHHESDLLALCDEIYEISDCHVTKRGA